MGKSCKKVLPKLSPRAPAVSLERIIRNDCFRNKEIVAFFENNAIKQGNPASDEQKEDVSGENADAQAIDKLRQEIHTERRNAETIIYSQLCEKIQSCTETVRLAYTKAKFLLTTLCSNPDLYPFEDWKKMFKRDDIYRRLLCPSKKCATTKTEEEKSWYPALHEAHEKFEKDYLQIPTFEGIVSLHSQASELKSLFTNILKTEFYCVLKRVVNHHVDSLNLSEKVGKYSKCVMKRIKGAFLNANLAELTQETVEFIVDVRRVLGMKQSYEDYEKLVKIIEKHHRKSDISGLETITSKWISTNPANVFYFILKKQECHTERWNAETIIYRQPREIIIEKLREKVQSCSEAMILACKKGQFLLATLCSNPDLYPFEDWEHLLMNNQPFYSRLLCPSKTTKTKEEKSWHPALREAHEKFENDYQKIPTFEGMKSLHIAQASELKSIFINMLHCQFDRVLGRAVNLHVDSLNLSEKVAKYRRLILNQIKGAFCRQNGAELTQETVEFIVEIRRVLGMKQSYEDYVNVIEKIKQTLGKKNYSDLETIGGEWISKNPAKVVRLFYFLLKKQEAARHKLHRLFPQCKKIHTMRFDTHQIYYMAKEFGIMFPKEMWENEALRAARSSEHPHHHGIMLLHEEFFLTANLNKEETVGGNKWFGFSFKIDGTMVCVHHDCASGYYSRRYAYSYPSHLQEMVFDFLDD